MAKAKQEANDIMSANRQAMEQGMKQWAQFSERFTGVALNMAQRTTDIAANANKEAIANMREAVGVREDMTDYSRAMSELMQKQADLTSRTLKAYGEAVAEAQSNAAEMASETAENAADTATSTAKTTAKKAQSASEKAA